MFTRTYGRTPGTPKTYRHALRSAMSLYLTAPFFRHGRRWRIGRDGPVQRGGRFGR